MELRYQEREEVPGHGVEGFPPITGLRYDGVVMLARFLAKAAKVMEMHEERANALGFPNNETRLFAENENIGTVRVQAERDIDEGDLHAVSNALGAPAYPPRPLELVEFAGDDITEYVRGATVPTPAVVDFVHPTAPPGGRGPDLLDIAAAGVRAATEPVPAPAPEKSLGELVAEAHLNEFGQEDESDGDA